MQPELLKSGGTKLWHSYFASRGGFGSEKVMQLKVIILGEQALPANHWAYIRSWCSCITVINMGFIIGDPLLTVCLHSDRMTARLFNPESQLP